MATVYFNGKFIPKEEVIISPDDRGFLFADGIYEVVRWYEGFFFDMNGHIARLKRSLRELRIKWNEADHFEDIAEKLIKQNKLDTQPAMVYLQVTRGAAIRSHSFPSPDITPTVYSYAWGFTPDLVAKKTGIKVMLKEDIRWSRCDIKSVALLANTISFQEACDKGLKECIFVRNGLITEGSHSNIFFIIDGTLFTHPESDYILSGVTRNNILRIAGKAGIKIREEAVHENMTSLIQEAFITSTSAEITPVIELGGNLLSDGFPGEHTRLIMKGFEAEIKSIKG
jgi:D-alanine transaminase